MTIITLEQVKANVEIIKGLSHDDEAARAEEDDLHQRVLRQLAQEGSELAAEALKTLDINFSRWCA